MAGAIDHYLSIIEMLACKLFGDTKNGYVSAYKYDFSPPKAANTGACGTLNYWLSSIYKAYFARSCAYKVTNLAVRKQKKGPEWP